MDLVGFLIGTAGLVVVLGTMFTPPLFLAVVALTLGGDRRSRRAASGAGADAGRSGEAPVPEVSRFSRPAKVVAFTILTLAVPNVLIAVTTYWFSLPEWVNEFLFRATVALIAIEYALIILLVVLMLAVLWDVWARRRVSGRDARTAYLVVGGMYAVQAAVLGVMVATGAQFL